MRNMGIAVLREGWIFSGFPENVNSCITCSLRAVLVLSREDAWPASDPFMRRAVSRRGARYARLVTMLVVALWAGSVFAAGTPLSREQAAKLIRAHATIAAGVTSARIGVDELNIALREGVVVQPGPYEALTEKGKRYFASYSMLAGATLARPLRIVVTAVTGVRDQGVGAKVAEFVWHVEGLDADIARYTRLNNADQSGEALFRLYDDGWRIVNVKTKFRGGIPNTRPLSSTQPGPPAGDASAKARTEICALARAWAASATDFNTYYLYEHRGAEAPLPVDDRKDGIRTVDQIRRALVGTYIHTRRFPATDPYGNPYLFEVFSGGNDFAITSLGADGKRGGGDDIINSNGEWLQPGPAPCL